MNLEIPAPTPNTARPAPIPVIAAKKTPLSDNKAILPPNWSFSDNKTTALFTMDWAQSGLEKLLSPFASPAIPAPIPNTARPTPIPDIAA